MLYTYGGSQSKIGLGCHNVKAPIYMGGWDFCKIIEGEVRDFFKKWRAIHVRGLSMKERLKQCLSYLNYFVD